MKLLGAEIMTGLKKLNGPDFDLTAAKAMALAALEAVKQGKLGYAIICGTKKIPNADVSQSQLGKIVRTACRSL